MGREVHHRRSIRLPEYDYAQAGAYFVTVCTQGRECLFGNIENREMVLSTAGQEIQRVWKDLPTRFPSVELDVSTTMPNHVHGIIMIVGAGLALPRGGDASPVQLEGAASSAPTLGDVVRVFKSFSAIQVNRLLSRSGQPLWQRNYYEHIIRSEDELSRVRDYIANNPLQWEMDRENPVARMTKKPTETWQV